MRRKLLLLSTLLATLILGNCSQSDEGDDHLDILLSTKTPAPIPTVSEIKIEQSPIIEPTPTEFNLSFLDSCYSMEEIKFNDLDLPEGKGILVMDRESPSEAIRLISPDLESTITVFDPFVNQGEFLGISPDGKWILVMIQEDPINDDEFPVRKIFVRSLFGDEEWLLASLQYEGLFRYGDLIITTEMGSGYISISDVKFGPGAGWASEGNIYIYSQLAGATSTSQMFPVISVDIFTGEIKPFFDTQSLGMGEWYIGRYSFNEKPNDLFYSSFDVCPDCFGRFFLYDQLVHEEIPVLSWLDREEWMGWLWTAVGKAILWQIQDGTVNLIVLKQYGIDAALNLSLEEIKEIGLYESRMTKLIIPPGSFQSPEQDLLDLGGVYPEWLSRHFNLAIFEGNLEEGSRYYLIDFSKLEIEEFCQSSYFPMHNPIETDDMRFIAWDRWNGVSADTIIFDMLLSQVAVVENVEFTGWAFDLSRK